MLAWSCSKDQYSRNSSEPDDVYFTSADREKALYEDIQASSSQSGSSYSSKNVNPEYIKKYKDESRKQVEVDQNGEYEEEYYNEDVASSKKYDRYSNNNNSWSYNNPGFNNYYGYSPYNYPGAWGGGFSSFYDPFWGPSFNTPRSSVWIGFGWGSGWGGYNSWGYDPWGWNSWGYGGWGRPFNSWHGMNAYNSGFYQGYYYGNVGRNDGMAASRSVYRGPRYSRSSSITNNTVGGMPRGGVSRNPSINTGRTNTSSSMRTSPSSDYNSRRPSVRGSRGSAAPVYGDNGSNRRIVENNNSAPSSNFNSRPSRPSRAETYSSPSSGSESRGSYYSRPTTTESNTRPRVNRSSDSNWGGSTPSTPPRSSGSEFRTNSGGGSRGGGSYSAPSAPSSSPSRSSGGSSGGGTRGSVRSR